MDLLLTRLGLLWAWADCGYDGIPARTGLLGFGSYYGCSCGCILPVPDEKLVLVCADDKVLDYLLVTTKLRDSVRLLDTSIFPSSLCPARKSKQYPSYR